MIQWPDGPFNCVDWIAFSLGQFLEFLADLPCVFKPQVMATTSRDLLIGSCRELG